MSNSIKRLIVDEAGIVKINPELKLEESLAREILMKLTIDSSGRATSTVADQIYWLESFDDVYVAQSFKVLSATEAEVELAYQIKIKIKLSSICLDDFDRFHARTESGIPLVFSRSAQEMIFNSADEYDDDSITFKGQTYNPGSIYKSNTQVQKSEFWDQAYQESRDGWEQNAPAKALKSIIPQLKLNAMRVAVIGAGSAEDAAYLAELGHFVTAIDFSAEAIQRARSKFSHLEKLKFVQCDAFHLPQSMYGQFDMIFEHTFYCAVEPSKRSALVKQWSRLLSPKGFLLGIFFVMDKPQGPPYGGTEWELKKRLDPSFHSLYWTRWREEDYSRAGQELVVYAQKK